MAYKGIGGLGDDGDEFGEVADIGGGHAIALLEEGARGKFFKEKLDEEGVAFAFRTDVVEVEPARDGRIVSDSGVCA